ncbi:MAG TPA: response regulator [Armatimonadota bacterium]|nr:response regulator [Armatimonadota bacterium]
MPTEVQTNRVSATTGLPSLRVLVCQGDGATVTKLRQMLTAAGHTVAGEANSGEECLALVQEVGSDVVLMEVALPGMDGVATTQRLMAQRPLPVVMLTACVDDDTVRATAAGGAAAYLVKPVSARQLLSTLRVAATWFAKLRQAKQDVQNPTEIIEARKLVERAKGVLMDRVGLTADEALQRLQETSRERDCPIKQITLEVIEAAHLMALQMSSGIVEPRRHPPVRKA